MPEFIQAYKTYIKTIAAYLNPNRTVVDKDIDDIFQLEKNLAQVLYIYID